LKRPSASSVASPFGSSLPNRAWSDVSRGYRYGFNGKEKDAEGMGGGSATYDYGFRIYNPNLGKFLSVDPLSYSYPWNSNFAYAENDVIRSIDLDGCEKMLMMVHQNSTNSFLTAADLSITLEYMVVTKGRGDASSLMLDKKQFSDIYSKGNCTLYFSELPTSTAPGTLLTGKLEELAFRAANGSRRAERKLNKMGVNHVSIVDVQFNFNLKIESDKTVEDVVKWNNEDPSGRGMLMTQIPDSDMKITDPKYLIYSMKVHNSKILENGGNYGGRALVEDVDYTDDIGVNFKNPSDNLTLINSGVTFITTTKITVHETGHNIAAVHRHDHKGDLGMLDYTYELEGLQSNTNPYPTLDNVLNIINDPTNRKNMTTNKVRTITP
jgi:RHS repeat-associated protein